MEEDKKIKIHEMIVKKIISSQVKCKYVHKNKEKAMLDLIIII